MDIAQYRLDKAARIARGEPKAPAPVSIDPPPLPPEAFVNVAAEVLAEAAPVVPSVVPSNVPAPTTWTRVKERSEE